MADVLWADVSEWQCPVNDSYPHPVLAVRANDGTYRDQRFATNYEWMRGALDAGRLAAGIVYMVYRSNWYQTLQTTKAMVGEPHPNTAFMIDLESWGGQIVGDQSHGINSLYWGLAQWLGDRKRVIGYGNTGDLDVLWPSKPRGLRLVVAAYGSNPDYPGKLGHQFASDHDTAPFGPCDINSADGYTVEEFRDAIGLGTTTGGRMTPEEHEQLIDVRAQHAGTTELGKYPGWPARPDLTDDPKTLTDYVRAIHAAVVDIHAKLSRS